MMKGYYEADVRSPRYCRNAIKATQPATMMIAILPMMVSSIGDVMTTRLPITQETSRAVIIRTLLWLGKSRIAADTTNNANATRKTPTVYHTSGLFNPEMIATDGANTIRPMPVTPELIPLISNTFFKVIIVFVFCLMIQSYPGPRGWYLSMHAISLSFYDNRFLR
jgi:hypothetical protein